jgi:ADP-heptose:LPS heptosyltransferase
MVGINDVTLDDLSWVKGNAESFGIRKPYALLVPGAAPDRPEKRWSASGYGALARGVGGWGFTPVIVGTLNEKEAAEAIRKIYPDAVDLTGQTALSDVVALARGAAAAIGNDTGPMHLIAPTGCPTWIIFSRHSNPARHAPPGPNVKAIQKDELAGLSAQEVLSHLSARAFRRN